MLSFFYIFSTKQLKQLFESACRFGVLYCVVFFWGFFWRRCSPGGFWLSGTKCALSDVILLMKASNESQPDALCRLQPSIIQGAVLLPLYLTSTIWPQHVIAHNLWSAADTATVLGEDVSSRPVTAALQIQFPSQLKDQVGLLSPSHFATNCYISLLLFLCARWLWTITLFGSLFSTHLLINVHRVCRVFSQSSTSGVTVCYVSQQCHFISVMLHTPIPTSCSRFPSTLSSSWLAKVFSA